MMQWLKDNVVSIFGDTTNKLADWLSQDSTLGLDNKTVKESMPYVAAGAVGIAGVAFLEPLTKVGRWITSGVKSVVTGFGLFEQIPLVGGAFSFAGEMVDKAADYSGYALTGAASFLTYHMFRSKVTPPVFKPHEAPDLGTGAVGEEPESVVIRERHVPHRPRPITATAPEVQTLRQERPDVAALTYPMLRSMRVKTLQEATSDPVLAEQLRALMQERNQQYENRRLFLQRVSEFDSGNPNSTRENLVAILRSEGLSERDVYELVPRRPQLRYTVTHGATTETDSLGSDGKPTDFGGEFAQLESLGRRMENFYGKGYFQVYRRDASGQKVLAPEDRYKSFDEMSVTQKQEFLEQALQNSFKLYTQLAPKVSSRTAVTSATYVSVSTTSWVDYGGIEKTSYTFRNQKGEEKILNGKQVYEFVSGLNGDRVSITNFTSSNYAYRTSGQSVSLGREFAAVGNAFQDWQTLLDKHRFELDIAETTYKGKISQYIRQVTLLDRSVKLMDSQKVALISTDKNQLRIRDLSGDMTAEGKGTSYTLLGDWTDETQSKFIVRGFKDADGKEYALREFMTIDLDNGDNFKELLVNMKSLRAVRQEGQDMAPIVVSLDRTQNASLVVLRDPNIEIRSNQYRFTGSFDGDTFTATGLVDPVRRKPIPQMPESQAMKRKVEGDYRGFGDNEDDAVEGTYIYGGIVYKEVTIYDADNNQRTMVITRNGERNGKHVYKVSELSEHDKPWKDYSWYQAKGRHPYLKPGSEVELTGGDGWRNDAYMLRVAKVAAACMDNKPIDLENEARRRRYAATYPDYQRLEITPLASPVVVNNVNNPQDWQLLVTQQRYIYQPVIDKKIVHENDPLKTATAMMEISDRQSLQRTKILVHGHYKKDSDTFEVLGYELRAEDLAADKPGHYVELAEPIMLDNKTRGNYAAVIRHAQQKLATLPAVATPLDTLLAEAAPRPALTEARDEMKFDGQDEVEGFGTMKLYRFTDYRKGKTPQPYTMALVEDRDKPGNYQVLMLAGGHIAKKDEELINDYLPFMVEAQIEKNLMITKEELDAMMTDSKKAQEFFDKHSKLAESNLTINVLELKATYSIVRVTDHSKADKPTYDLVLVKGLERHAPAQVVGWAKPDSQSFTPISGVSIDTQNPDQWKAALQKIGEAAGSTRTTMIMPSFNPVDARDPLEDLAALAIPFLKKGGLAGVAHVA